MNIFIRTSSRPLAISYCHRGLLLLFVGITKQVSPALHVTDGTSVQDELQSSPTHCILAALILYRHSAISATSVVNREREIQPDRLNT
jgi:hypothetical protein